MEKLFQNVKLVIFDTFKHVKKIKTIFFKFIFCSFGKHSHEIQAFFQFVKVFEITQRFIVVYLVSNTVNKHKDIIIKSHFIISLINIRS